MQDFLRQVRRQFGVEPENYIVFDCETTGPKPGYDLMTQFGHCIVRNRRCVNRGVRVFNWVDSGLVDVDWLRGRMADTQEAMERNGSTYHTKLDDLRAGDNPADVLRDYVTIFEEAREKGYVFLGHNAWNFDRKMFTYHLQRYLGGHTFDWTENELFDTGVLAKASQLDSPPRSTDTLKSWAARISAIRAKGVYWSLDRYCVPQFDLERKYELDLTMAHDASHDAFVTHCLFEEFRKIVEGEPCITS